MTPGSLLGLTARSTTWAAARSPIVAAGSRGLAMSAVASLQRAVAPAPRATFTRHARNRAAHIGRAAYPRPRSGKCMLRATPGDDLSSGVDPIQPSVGEGEMAVPADQRPVQELSQLKDSFMYSWAQLEGGALAAKLGGLFGGVVAFLGAPIAWGTFPPSQYPAEFALSAATSGLVVVAASLVRIYLGWSYVGNRLLSAAVEYEESGWYDGQVWVKPPEVLARDRLLGSYEVAPALNRLKTTLLGTGAALGATAVLLAALVGGADEDETYGAAPMVTADGVVYRKVTKDGARPAGLSDLAYDDFEANAEAEAIAKATGKPAYCSDRYFKAVSGGAGC